MPQGRLNFCSAWIVEKRGSWPSLARNKRLENLLMAEEKVYTICSMLNGSEECIRSDTNLF